ncbi:MAG: ABC transporter substrate binding protein [Candidatus Sungiibacteriota bacterium]
MDAKIAHSVRVWGALALLLAGLFVFGLLAMVKVQRKAAPETPFTIGVLISGEARAPVVEGMKDGFSALGFSNFRLVIKDAGGDPSKIEAVLGELIKERPDYILAIGGAEADALAKAETDIPKFFALVTQPERHGIAFPGVLSSSPDLMYERMEFAQKILPEIKIFTVLTSTTTLGGVIAGEKAREFAAKNPGYSVAILEFGSPDEIKRFAETINKNQGVVFAAPATAVALAFPEILKGARARGVPLVAWSGDLVEQGALFSYGDESSDIGREAAFLLYEAAVKKTPYSGLGIKKVKPALVINKRIADSLGIRIPSDILKQAAKIVE